jgi:hypothetical protein
MRLYSMTDGPLSVVSTAPIMALDAVGPSTPTISVQTGELASNVDRRQQTG